MLFTLETSVVALRFPYHQMYCCEVRTGGPPKFNIPPMPHALVLMQDLVRADLVGFSSFVFRSKSGFGRVEA